MRPGSRPVAVAVACALAGCVGPSTSPVGHVRFHNQPPIWAVNDRRDVPAPPKENKFLRSLYHFDGVWHKRLDRWMQMRPVRRAVNVNSLDEVPDSTWFTNRIGVRDLGLDEIRRGPNVTGSPEGHRPWVIESSKVGGITVGFIIVDQRGVKYVLKFDVKDEPEMETGADIVLQRLLWACGFNVPEDYIVQFEQKDLVRAKDAVIKDPMGNEQPMTDAFIERQLAKVNIGRDGKIRGLVSQYIAGKPLGGHVRDGVREDDPNDTIPHELRRENRGTYAIFSWLDQTDVKEDNTLDTYIEDPSDPKVHYVVHYLIDFGKGLGDMGYYNRRHWVGFAYIVDFAHMAASSLTLGIWQRPWEGRKEPTLTGVGTFESKEYNPGRWKPYTPSYFPFHDADRFDNFWGAKILVRFTRDQLRAAVEEGRYSDPRAVEYLTDTLVDRQRKTARHWFEKVAPVHRFDVAGDRLCFEDLAVRYRLAPEGPTRYAARAFDHDGRPTGWSGEAASGPDGRACLQGIRPSGSRDGYTIVELRTLRSDLPATLVHLATEPGTSRLRVIGLRRL